MKLKHAIKMGALSRGADGIEVGYPSRAFEQLVKALV